MKRPTLCAALLAAALLLCSAAPADLLTKARTEIGNNHAYSADSWLQQVVDASDAKAAQVEEALYLQTMIYYGDVFGAAMVLPPVTEADKDGCTLGAEASRQLLLARRAFVAAAGRYLTTTASGSSLQRLQLDLPAFSEDDAKKLTAALKDRASMKKIVDSYDKEPAAGKGLLAKANQFGMTLGFASAVPRTKDRRMADVRSKLKAGVPFDKAAYLNWLADVSVEMHGIVREPNGPKMLDLAKRCDERLKKVVGKDSATYLKSIEARSKKYAN